MKTLDIFKELGLYLTPIQVEILKLTFSLPASVQLAMSVSDIVHEYNSTQANEDKVCVLLVQLLKNHYKKA